MYMTQSDHLNGDENPKKKEKNVYMKQFGEPNRAKSSDQTWSK